MQMFMPWYYYCTFEVNVCDWLHYWPKFLTLAFHPCLCSSSYYQQSLFPNLLTPGTDMELTWPMENGWDGNILTRPRQKTGIACFSSLLVLWPYHENMTQPTHWFKEDERQWTFPNWTCFSENPRQAQDGLAESLLNCTSMSKISAIVVCLRDFVVIC